MFSVAMFIVMISILGGVYASDVNVNDSISTNDYSSGDITYSSSYNSFRDLSSDISSSNVINLSKDYVFDAKLDSDYANGINISKHKGLVINGNNHTIDADNNAVIFRIINSNMVLNDIVFKNSNNTALFSNMSNVTMNNVEFINELNNSRAIGTIDSNITCNNTRFVDNYNDDGSSIYVFKSNLELLNSNFTNKNELKWSSVYIDEGAYANIVNCTFTNITSKYAPAIYFNHGTGTIRNTLFNNLNATLTGGAVAIKDINGTVYIINSSFINVTSQKNGGAVFTDVGNDGLNATIILKDSLFDSCNSLFGGAYLQLGGSLIIENTTFNNNSATISGGAVYTSFTDLDINNSKFSNNEVIYDDDYYSRGGALFLDKTNLNLYNSTFLNNDAVNGEDICLYDSAYSIRNSYFNGNIHSYFDVDSFLNDNVFMKENKLNDTYYSYANQIDGVGIDYNPVILNESLANSSYFNLVDYGLVTSVKNQGSMNACWAFGTVAALESAFLKATNKTLILDISENNVQNIGLKYSPYGFIALTETGNNVIGASYFTSFGVTNAVDDEYDELGKISPLFESELKYNVYDVVLIPTRKNVSDNLKLKEALIKYGAIAVFVHGATGSNSGDYNSKTAAAYYNSTFGEGSDHLVTLVGWDDNFSKENFLITPPNDGAWIIKNSWGSEWGDNGYYYVSYYDTAFAASDTNGSYSVAFIVNDNNNYEVNYEYDLITSPRYVAGNGSNMSYANSFKALRNELITAVGTFFNDSGVDYELKIYVDDEEVYQQKGTSTHSGYETIKLNQAIGVKENHTFVIEMNSNNMPIVTSSRQHYMENTSFIIENEGLMDITTDNMVTSLKAYTILDKSSVKTTNLTTRYGSGKYLEVTYYDKDGELLTNEEVEFIINNKTYTRTTDNNGKAILDVNLQPGRYNVIIVNPTNLEKTNVKLVITGNTAKKTHSTINNHKFTKTIDKQAYKIYVNNKLITQSNIITIQTLNTIFNQTFTNGHLLIYVDGELVFNDTVTDDIYKVLFEITSKLLGQHELKVEFTDSDNKTQSYTENITLQ